MTKTEAQVAYPHLVNLPLAEKLEKRRVVIDHFTTRVERAAKAKLRATDETFIAKSATYLRAMARLDEVRHGCGWMPYYDKLTAR